MRILVVEDEVKIAQAIQKGLQQEAFAVDMVHDGDSGLAAARSDDYDLVILDWMLPGEADGQQICQQLRREGVTVPVLMLTAKDGVDSRVLGLNSGADDYLVKPFSFDELVARIKALLRRPAQNIEPVITVGDLEIDTAQKQVRRQGKDIPLTVKEFALLNFLAHHPGQVLSKEKLLQHLWNDDSVILPNTIEVYIGYIRNKIDKPFGKPLIKTVRGFGYKLAA
jgi:DNA-binding response OmpR family regulator